MYKANLILVVLPVIIPACLFDISTNLMPYSVCLPLLINSCLVTHMVVITTLIAACKIQCFD